MAALNETPRQKMMGILYLVLLGLAATTVTDHVLDAFHNLTQSLETSTKNVQGTVSNTFSAFEATNLKNDPVRATPIYERAKKVKQYSAELDKYINEIKNTMITKGGGLDEASGDVKNRADVDLSPHMMIKGEHLALQLKKRIEDTRNKILASLDPKEREGLKLALNAQDPPKRKGTVKTSWEEDNFGEGIPLTAAITALTKIQADLKNTESDVVKKILGEADKAVINLDRFEAVAVAPSSYVLIGQPYKAEIFLSSSSSTSNPEVIVGGQKLNVVDGKGMYTVVGTSEGEKKYSGVINIKQSDGTIKPYTLKEQSYTVAKPSAVVSPDKMNVFYMGLPNPVSVSAPGFSKDKLRATISSGEISGSNGQYIVKVTQPGKVTVSISGEVEKGNVKPLTVAEFRVKRLPTPLLKFAGKTTGKLNAGVLKSQNKLFAVYEDFDFEVPPFNVQHFVMLVSKPRSSEVTRLESNSGSLTPAMMSATAGLGAGSRVLFDDAYGIGADGQKRSLNPIMFTVE